MIVCATPAFAENECKRCDSWSSGGSAAAFCAPVQRDQMGNLKCRVQCYVNENDIGICECQEAGDWCMIIVVEG